MNKLLVVSKAEGIGKYYCEELRDFFDDAIVIDYIAMDYENVKVVEEYDLIIITTHTIVEHIMQYVRKDSRILKMIKTLDPKGIRKIESIPYGSEALVVNVGPKTVSESIYLIYALGRSDLELHPYYPGIEKYKTLDYVITQGERAILPDIPGKVIDIYNTMIDSKTFLEIISYFNLDKKKFLGKMMDRGRMRNKGEDGMSLVINERFMFEEIINVMFENLNEGVLIYDSTGRVTSNSRSTEKFLNKNSYNIIGKKITDLIPVKDQVVFGQTLAESIVRINNTPLICNVMPEMILGGLEYGVIILKKYNDEEVRLHRFRKELVNKGHRTKYSIDDIVGSSQEMMKIKDIALRISKSDSTVLINGESGTGKELFAHVIHNNSKRSSEQFVAVNCSAIPENLLESELFGYEEGAFTGAKKGGKSGLFEIANGGTLFLDEIGEIPLHLQSRLLRVLQEKEIMRVGSNDIVSIDVRIITATNIDMKKQVDDGSFRKDLYYRLSVLPLNIPPLRNRGNDVIEIFEQMNSKADHRLLLDDSVKAFMCQYHWDGNVRELSNCYEYLLNLGKEFITLSDFPERMRQNDTKIMTKIKSIDMTILDIIHRNNIENKRVGRKSIANLLTKINIYMGEQEVRQVLLALQSRGLVTIGKGRAGTRITDEGIAQLMNK
jgi:transcriptional regulator with PAS, ATPase and Fis domain